MGERGVLSFYDLGWLGIVYKTPGFGELSLPAPPSPRSRNSPSPSTAESDPSASPRSPSMFDSPPSFQIELLNDLASPPAPIPPLQTSLSSSSSFSARHEFASSNSLGLSLSTSSSVSRSTLASARPPSSQHTLLPFKSRGAKYRSNTGRSVPGGIGYTPDLCGV